MCDPGRRPRCAAVCAQAAQPGRALLHAKGGAYGHKHHAAKHAHGAYGADIPCIMQVFI